ncbi:MAG: tyrosine-protein phosphatase [Verrucomicrobiota bacterium]
MNPPTQTSRLSLGVLVASLLLLAGCATRPAVVRSYWDLPDDGRFKDEVKNFGEVTPYLWRGAQPTRAGFRKLEAAKVKTIVNLRSDHDDFPLLKNTSLKYVRIPMRAYNPGQGDIAQLVLVMKTLATLTKDPKARPVFIHCAEGRDRTGYSVAAYRIVFEGRDRNSAIAEMFDYHFNRVWFRNPQFLRDLDAARIRALVSRAP